MSIVRACGFAIVTFVAMCSAAGTVGAAIGAGSFGLFLADYVVIGAFGGACASTLLWMIVPEMPPRSRVLGVTTASVCAAAIVGVLCFFAAVLQGFPQAGS